MKPVTGIVLEGGALRGMFTAGVLDVLLRKEISADKLVGVSAGALFGVNFVSGQLGRAIRYNKRFNGDPEYMGIRPLLREGNMVSTEYAYHRVPFELDPFDNEAFMASPAEFYAVTTDVSDGHGEYVLIQNVYEQMDVLRASGSMPFVSRAVPVGGRKYLDGALADSIPFEWMKAQGVDKLIVILTRDGSYRKKPMSRAPAELYRFKYPAVRDALLRRHEVYNAQLDLLRRWEQEGKAFVIRPTREVSIGRVERDPDKLQAVYDLGVEDMEALLPALKQYLAE